MIQEALCERGLDAVHSMARAAVEGDEKSDVMFWQQQHGGTRTGRGVATIDNKGIIDHITVLGETCINGHMRSASSQ